MYEQVMLSKQSACDRQTGRQADFAARAHNPRNTGQAIQPPKLSPPPF